MRLVDAATLQRGFDLPTQERKPGSFPLVSSAGISDSHECSAAFGPGVVTGRSGSIGNVFYIEDDFWPLNTVLYVKDFHGNYPRFIYYLLQNFDLRRFASGSGVPTLNRNFVHDEIVHIPPLPEQQRIVAILDEAFEAIATAKANTEKNLQNARTLFESHLHNVFTHSDGKHRLRKLGDVCERITVGHVGSMASKYQASGIPFLRSQNVRPFQISLDNVVYIDEIFDAALRKSRLRPGDVAVVRTGYPGTAAVIPDTLPIANCSDLVIVRPGPNTDPHYLTLFFNSRLGKELVAGEIVGAAQKHFNISAAKDVEIAFPPLGEQAAIVERMHTFRHEIQSLEAVYARKQTALDSLKSSLLHQAFTGNL